MPTTWPACLPLLPDARRHRPQGGATRGERATGRPARDRDDKIVNTWALDVLDGQIQTIRTVLNPDKLEHLGPVADPWAVFRRAKEARRPTD